MKRAFSKLLVVICVVLAGVVAWAWYDVPKEPGSIGFVWRKQKWEITSTHWQLRIDNVPQRQMESNAPEAEAHRLVNLLDELFDLERLRIQSPTDWTKPKTGLDARDIQVVARLRVEESEVLARLSEIGYVPEYLISPSGGKSLIPYEDGRQAFFRSPLAPAPPKTKLESLAAPYPLLLALLLLLPARASARELRRLARKLRMQCVTCGYDLRASKDRCPECGTPIPAKGEA